MLWQPCHACQGHAPHPSNHRQGGMTTLPPQLQKLEKHFMRLHTVTFRSGGPLGSLRSAPSSPRLPLGLPQVPPRHPLGSLQVPPGFPLGPPLVSLVVPCGCPCCPLRSPSVFPQVPLREKVHKGRAKSPQGQNKKSSPAQGQKKSPQGQENV